MKAVLQRVKQAKVEVEGETIGEIGVGLLILIGIAPEDTEDDARYLVDRLAHLRVFPDERGRFDRSLVQIGGEALVVSQFTLFGDCRRGRRPSFTGAARPEHAIPLYERLCALLGEAIGRPVATGRFGADMAVSLVNDGPVTLSIDSPPRAASPPPPEGPGPTG